ncbi:hypothetical protein [Bradyrhizobium sp. WSM471]|uniref:hypothetical protein n=1 Tax=Bradyrhizobium sp. WSM471 TaxID=319017 RepID=UPI0012FB9034|nr:MULTISPECIES: hypothetical protein [Bradyrhizobium]UFW43196.1 hypothetical protein BcanWSM471_08985 [Bradyrhizobium canariense]
MRHHIRRGGFVCPATRAIVILKRPSKHETLDLVEMRRKTIALRTRHSDNARVTYLLNWLLIKTAYLTEAESAAQAKRLWDAFTETMADVEKIITQGDQTPSSKANK